MPYNPEDPNSDPHNPEGATAPVSGSENLTEELVRICHPQSATRGQAPEVLATVEKMGEIWIDLSHKKITQSEANAKLDDLAGDVATHITEQLTLELVNRAIESIKNPNPPLE
jgi:hypothetical protein